MDLRRDSLGAVTFAAVGISTALTLIGVTFWEWTAHVLLYPSRFIGKAFFSSDTRGGAFRVLVLLCGNVLVWTITILIAFIVVREVRACAGRKRAGE